MANKLVAVVNGSFAYHNMLHELGYDVVKIDTLPQAKDFEYSLADAVLFCGGADINPDIYNEPKHPKTHCDGHHDILDYLAFIKAKADNPNIKFMGICRGGQFLCAMAGGKLIQHCTSHAIGGTHKVEDYNGLPHNVTSTHHQMQFPENMSLADYEVLVSGLVDNVRCWDAHGEVFPVVQYEAVWYKNINALAFQPHPEYHEETKQLFEKCLNRSIFDKGM